MICAETQSSSSPAETSTTRRRRSRHSTDDDPFNLQSHPKSFTAFENTFDAAPAIAFRHPFTNVTVFTAPTTPIIDALHAKTGRHVFAALGEALAS